MSDDRDCFMRRICEQPDDDTVRLVFADWLEEHGEGARAAFIRWQCCGRFTHPYPRVSYRKWFAPWWAGRTRQHNNLVDGKMSLWVMKVRPSITAGVEPANMMRATRGFVSHIDLPKLDFTLLANSLFLQHPITRVRISDAKAFPSGGNRTYYLGGLGWFPKKYWSSLENLPSERAVIDATSAVCVAYGRELAGLPALELSKAVAS